jgi:hypothetical protein
MRANFFTRLSARSKEIVMRASLCFCSVVLVLAAIGLSASQESNPGKAARPADGNGKTAAQGGKTKEPPTAGKAVPGTAKKKNHVRSPD